MRFFIVIIAVVAALIGFSHKDEVISSIESTFSSFGHNISKEQRELNLKISAETTFKRPPSAIRLKAVMNGGSTIAGRRIKDISWYINDKLVGSKESMTYTVNKSGTYKVVAKVVNDEGTEFEERSMVNIGENVPPDCSLKYTSPATSGKLVYFNAVCNKVDGKIIKYVWNYGDGTDETAVNRHIYNDPGVYVVTVRVFDDSGDSGVANIKVSVH